MRASAGAEAAVELATSRLGGTVERRLDIINGFAARIPAAQTTSLQAVPGVLSVTRDSSLHLLGTTYSPGSDPYSLYNIENQIGNRTIWKNATGAGVGVALIDSGVTPVAGLNNPGQVIYGPDLTEESQNPNVEDLDTFGHGTFMASIIAGHDPGVDPATNTGNQTAFMGAAPDAHIVSVKVADAYGMTDVSQVIAGIDWVVQHASDPGLNIRVLNLSFGTNSTQSYLLDPLAFAAEVAWRSGITVVTSAGNGGAQSNGLTTPADDPRLLSVGAVDMHGYPDGTHATIPSFSSSGDGVRNPDLVAPGAHIQGLRVAGSYVDDQYGSTGLIDSRYFRGSGTSQAAAFVSGSLAQLFQRWPNMTPDQAKQLLVSTTTPVPKSIPATLAGAGIINMRNAGGAKLPPPVATQTFKAGTGTGSLDASRGGAHIQVNGVPLSGEQDIFGHAFNTATMATAEANGQSWSCGNWNGNTWAGCGWTNGEWAGHTWSGNDWSGHTWSGDNWSDGTWDGFTWSNTTWDGYTWSGFTWSGADWSSSIWATGSWS